MVDMSGFDLTKFQKPGKEQDEIKNILGRVLSGREGYEAIIETKKEIKKCTCGQVLDGCEKFCPECGAKCKF